MPDSLRRLTHLLPLLSAGLVAVLVSYASSAAIVFQALKAAGATPHQLGEWLSTLGIAMGLTTLALTLRYKMPILTAWSTPGAALLVTSLHGATLAQAVGIFMFASALTLLCALTGLFTRLMNTIPLALANAMLAGILLRFGLSTFQGLAVDPLLCGSMCAAYLLARRLLSRFAIVLTLIAGLLVAAGQGTLPSSLPTAVLAIPHWVTPDFSLPLLIGVGLPWFLVTMASQNAPGIATLQAFNYPAPPSPLLGWTALTSLLLAPLGGFSICIAAISAALCMGPDVHPDPHRRWLAAIAAGGFYLLAGTLGGWLAVVMVQLSPTLINTLAGLALLSTLGGSLLRALQPDAQREAALIAFLITASGVTLWGISAACWGLLAGVCCLRWLRPR
ncbi:benzoate/H(+) symporter BenE family transporter [Pantoea sp. 1.19]|uniref:benzoate/H(+) symporter BenE family transporter n=1 Tax=Pantoea sp. 1.19 TaxID=1925589 RepID=UPI000948C6EC|nr:benzoate/H(+) symporter BenE family transporter [Pantoea sp. 1.19]